MQRSMANARIFRIPQKYCNRNKPLFFSQNFDFFVKLRTIPVVGSNAENESSKVEKVLLMELWIRRWCKISAATESRGWTTANNFRMWIHNHTSITTLTHWNRSQIGKIFAYSMNLISSVAVQWRKQYYARNRQQKKKKNKQNGKYSNK